MIVVWRVNIPRGTSSLAAFRARARRVYVQGTIGRYRRSLWAEIFLGMYHGSQRVAVCRKRR